jgi:ADP-ribose pyrophosphatase YjhB (NUDIX family)
MVAASILPVTIHNGKLMFLFGKECDLEQSAPGWSDFGGGVEKGENLFKAALREGSEEMIGVLGDHKELGSLIKKNGGTYKLKHNDYHIHIFFLDYDEALPKYYNKIHRFIWNKLDHKFLYKTRIFEKSEIDWFSVPEVNSHRKEFRHFYQEMIDMILGDIENIEKFIISKSNARSNKLRKTVKNMN